MTGPILPGGRPAEGRPPKRHVDAWRPLSVLREQEPLWGGGVATPARMRWAEVTTLFLAGAECALRCTMCDLWRHTLDRPTPRGAIPEQMRQAIPERPSPGQAEVWVKLYNASNFFDRRCVPREDWPAIAEQVHGFGRVVVENHPRWVRQPIETFAGMLGGRLEIAMGLESSDPVTLRLLDKRFTPDGFRRAAGRLAEIGVDLRVFLMFQPPGTSRRDAVEKLLDSLRFAEGVGARHASIIPTRGGQPGMETLARAGRFTPPTASDFETAIEAALGLASTMVITPDLWDWRALPGTCARCSEPRRRRLVLMSRYQTVGPMPSCLCDCRDGGAAGHDRRRSTVEEGTR